MFLLSQCLGRTGDDTGQMPEAPSRRDGDDAQRVQSTVERLTVWSTVGSIVTVSYMDQH